MDDCLFCQIAVGHIPSKKIYEDEEMFAIHDIRPAAPVHFMIIPKLHIPSLMEVTEAHQSLLGKMLAMTIPLAREQGCHEGFRTIINTGKVGGQEVYHLHLHVLGSAAPLGAMLQRR